MATAHITYFFPVGSLHAREAENRLFTKNAEYYGKPCLLRSINVIGQVIN